MAFLRPTSSITFFRSEAAAGAMAAANGGAEAGFAAVEAKGRPGFYAIEIRDEDNGSFLGYL